MNPGLIEFGWQAKIEEIFEMIDNEDLENLTFELFLMEMVLKC